jgi:hypothetical protein
MGRKWKSVVQTKAYRKIFLQSELHGFSKQNDAHFFPIAIYNPVIVLAVQRGDIRGCIQTFPDWVITKYTLTTTNTCWEATQRVMAAKLTRLTHKIAIQLHLAADSWTICTSRSGRPVRKLLDTPSYAPGYWNDPACFRAFYSWTELRLYSHEWEHIAQFRVRIF